MGFNNFPDSAAWRQVQAPFMPAITEAEIVSAQVAEYSNEVRPQVEFISAMLSEWEGSVRKKNMQTAARYYRNEPDIMQARRKVIGRSAVDHAPVMMESTVLANNKLAHNFLKKLTRQKIGYMLGKPFILSEAKKDDPKAKQFFERCQQYMGKNFYKMIKNVARDSIVKGIGWLLVFYNEQGELKFRRCEPENVIPLWADSDHTVLDAIIYKYDIEVYTQGKKLMERHVDYYTTQGAYRYIWDDGTGLLTRVGSRSGPPAPYFSLRVPQVDEQQNIIGYDTVPFVWGKIPFIPFKYDPDEQSLLERIKALVDNYDKVSSEIANNIEDFPNSTMVVKNYDGTDKEEFVHNKNVFRTMFVTGDGDAKSLDTPLNIADITNHLQRLREDIYEFGQGVNTADKDIRDTSGVALRFLYADLDMDCVDWGSEFEWSIMELLWFVQQDLIGRQSEDYTDVRYNVQCRKDVIINESEQILNAFQSVGVISQRTVVENHPWVRNVEMEMRNMNTELEENLALKDEYGEEPQNPAQSQKTTLGQG